MADISNIFSTDPNTLSPTMFGGDGGGGGTNWLLPLLTALGAGAGGFSTPSNSNQSGTTNQTTNSDSNTQSSNFLQNLISSLSQINSQQQQTGTNASTSTTTPNLTPGTQQLIDQLTSRYQSLAAPSLTGYAAGQTQQINRNADLQNQSVQNIMASRGLASSPVAGTAGANVEAQRFGNISQMQAGLPLLQNQLNQQNLGAAANFMSMIPHGATTTTGGTTGLTTTGQQTQTGTQNQNQVGGSGVFNSTTGNSNTVNQAAQQQQQGGGIAGIMAGILSGMLGGLKFSDKRLKHDIKEIPVDKAVDKIMALRPVTWKWNGSTVKDTGLIAQDIQRVLPELVEKDPASGLLMVDYSGLISNMVGALQAINTKVSTL